MYKRRRVNRPDWIEPEWADLLDILVDQMLDIEFGNSDDELSRSVREILRASPPPVTPDA